MKRHTFIENGEDRKDTAVLLVGTAQEFMIPASDILPTPKGFWITERLADVLVEEGILSAEEADLATEDPAPAEDDASTEEEKSTPAPGKGNKKTSGNRAAKNKSEE